MSIKVEKLDPNTLRAVAKELSIVAGAKMQVANHPDLTNAGMGDESIAIAKTLRKFAKQYRRLANQLEQG
jgi:hypothetical protein